MATEARELTQPAQERINPAPENVDLGAYKFGWHDPVHSVFTPKKGLSHEVVEEISRMKGEPEWMRRFRHKALDYFYRKPMPQWGGDLSRIDFDNIYYFLRATEKQAASWEDLPADIKTTYDRLGIPEAEKQRLIAGVVSPSTLGRGWSWPNPGRSRGTATRSPTCSSPTVVQRLA